MVKQALMLLLVAGMASWSQAQKVPKEVQALVDNYVADSLGDFGFKAAKSFLRLDDPFLAKDIEVGLPIEEYTFDYDLLTTCDDTVPIRSIIQPLHAWLLPIRAHGKYIYQIEITRGKDNWHFSKLGGCRPENEWQKLRNAYPESTGITPILIRDCGRRYFHFPQKSTHNLSYIAPGYGDTLAMRTSRSLDTLDNSRTIIRDRKKQVAESRRAFERSGDHAPNPLWQKNMGVPNE